MKKLFIIATAALALAACSKTEVNDLGSNKAISFQVANYSNLITKAESIGTDNTFKVNSFVHTTLDGAPSTQQQMFDEVVSWNSTEKQWLPSRTYYWPKTGYVNFFAYTDLNSADPVYPTATAENQITYTSVDIANATDILVADAAYAYRGNSDAEYKLDGVTEGVPTLFHHTLAKVTFNVKLDATDAIPSDKYEWTVVVNESKFGFANQGTAVFNFTEQSTLGHVSWDNFDTDKIFWTKTGDNSAAPQTTAVTGDTNKMTATFDAKVSEVKTLFNEISVLPQDLNATGAYGQFSLQYNIKSVYIEDSADRTKDKVIEETVDIPLSDLKTYVPSVTNWNMNTKYTYNIIIKPGGPIHFDPAVVEWETVTAADKEI
mgnify:CR=1 FL=1